MLETTKRILPIALVAALLGGSVGAFVMRAPKTPDTANTSTPAATDQAGNTSANDSILAPRSNDVNLTPEQLAYRDGFEQGFLTSEENGKDASNYRASNSSTALNRTQTTWNDSAQANNHYTRTQPRGRSFWQKHRDKLTVAAGTGGGAVIGGLLGGKKGALIGGLAGAGGSALYTYKLRKRTPSY